MTLKNRVIDEVKKRESLPGGGLVGPMDPYTEPESEQMERMITSGFMRTAARWYSNTIRARFPDGILPVDTDIDAVYQEDLEDDCSYMLVTPDTIDYFRPYLLDAIIEDVNTRSDFICVGGVKTDGYTYGAMVIRVDECGISEIVWAYISPQMRGLGKGDDMSQYTKLILKEAGVKSVYNIFADYRSTTTEQELKEKYAGQNVFFDTITEHFVSIPYSVVQEKFSNVTVHKESCLLLDEIPDYFITEHLDTSEESLKKRINYFIEEAGRVEGAFDESSCVIYEDGKLKSMLLTVPREDGKGTVMILLHTVDASYMAATISFSIERAIRAYGEDGYLTIALLNGMGKSLGEFFAIDDSWVRVYAAGRNL